MKYNIIGEFYHEQRFYYVTKDKELLVAKWAMPMPEHPMVCYKKFNDEKYFDIVE